MTETHEVRRNCAFRGLSSEEAFSIDGYSHFRNVQNAHKLNSLMKDDACFQRDFLDEASYYAGCAWSVLKGSTRGDVAVIRNHEWPGYTVFHKVGSALHGAVYMGEGFKNVDLNF